MTTDADQFELEETGQRLPLGLAVVVLALAVGLGLTAYCLWFAGGGEGAREFVTEPVGRATIRSTIVASGVVEPIDQVGLRFATAGRVEGTLVDVGDEVQEGDPLIELDDEALGTRLSTAQSNLALAQINLRRLLKGASAAEAAAADQSVVSAEAALAQAERDLETLLDGATAAELAAADEAVISAQAALERARRDLRALTDGASDAELAAAEQAVVSARTARDRAQRDLDTLLEGPSDADLAAAEQAVAAAEASLASARTAYEQLKAGPEDVDLEAAQSSVVSAEQALASAEIALQTARSNVDSAEAALRAAGTSYCDYEDDDPLCSPFVMPLTSTTVSDLLDKLSDPDTSRFLVDRINGLIQANSAYVSGLNAVGTTEANVLSSQAALEAAQARLDALLEGPSKLDLAAAAATVDSAEASLESARLTLDELRSGGDPDDIATARDALDSAQASLDSALANQEDLLSGADADQIDTALDAIDSSQAALDSAVARRGDLLAGADASDIAGAQDAVRSARAALDTASAQRDDVLAGADAEDVDAQQEQVQQAQLAVQAAKRDLEDATLTSPFDGTVASVNVQVGDLAGTGLDAVTLLTPEAMKVEISLGETELPSVKTGMGGVITFDALPGRPFPISVFAINLDPRVESGVVTYTVDAAIQGVGGTGPQPAPGMNGAAILVSEQRTDVLAVPSQAIRRLGENLVVDLLVDGAAETRIIKTGLSDGEMTEVTEGVEEGDPVIVGTRRGGQPESNTAPTAADLPEGIR